MRLKAAAPLSLAPLLQQKPEKTMHLLFLPILADAGMTTASSGAVVIVILSIAAVIRSKMP